VKKLKSRAVKRVPSTKRGPRPKKILESVQPELPVPMIAAAHTPAPAADGPTASGRVVLGVACTIHEAQALRGQMLEQSAHPGPYEIDGSAVRQVDTAGVQLVVAFALDCLERGISYRWKGRSPALEEAIRVLGVGALLESPG